MKFMQKSKEQSEIEEDKETNLFNQNYDYLTKKQKYLFEPSYCYFEDLKFGRFSYKGMNVEIEKLQEELNEQKNLKNNGKNKKEIIIDDVEITDKEMAKRYLELTNRKAGASNKNKRKRND